MPRLLNRFNCWQIVGYQIIATILMLWGCSTADAQPRVIHVFVALCDNQYQGIVPVPARIGNGDDADNNLYWGAAYGVKTFFKRDRSWQLQATIANPKSSIIERIVFKHKQRDSWLIADAYRGREIKTATIDFLTASAGSAVEQIKIGNQSLNIGGAANLIVYVGHDGLMDFQLSSYPKQANSGQRDAVMLACISKSYFAAPLRQSGANPLIWTTGLMAPEAYVLKGVIDGWLLNEGGDKIRQRAAASYHQYQHCGIKAAQRLFATGW